MTNRIILAMVVLVLALSCSKENRETSVEGRVITFGTETKATNLPLRMGLYQTIVGTGLGTGEKLVEETVTDTNGFYQFTFKPEGNASYYLQLITPSVENYHDYSGFHLKLERGIKQKIDFVLKPYAWVKLRLVNQGPHFPGDKITYRIGVGGARHLYGPVNHEDIYLVFGNSQATVTCTVFRGDEVTQFKSVVPFVAAFDTISHLIEY